MLDPRILETRLQNFINELNAVLNGSTLAALRYYYSVAMYLMDDALVAKYLL